MEEEVPSRALWLQEGAFRYMSELTCFTIYYITRRLYQFQLRQENDFVIVVFPNGRSKLRAASNRYGREHFVQCRRTRAPQFNTFPDASIGFRCVSTVFSASVRCGEGPICC